MKKAAIILGIVGVYFGCCAMIGLRKADKEFDEQMEKLHEDLWKNEEKEYIDVTFCDKDETA